MVPLSYLRTAVVHKVICLNNNVWLAVFRMVAVVIEMVVMLWLFVGLRRPPTSFGLV